MAKIKTPQPCKCRSTLAYTVTADDVPEAPNTPDNPFVSYDVYQSCGTETASEFAPGHDARYKSRLIAAFRAGTDFAYLEGAMLIHADPIKLAAERDWSKFLTPAKARRSTRRTPKADRPSPQPCTVKIGRWTYPAILNMTNGIDAKATANVTYTKTDGSSVTVDIPLAKVTVLAPAASSAPAPSVSPTDAAASLAAAAPLLATADGDDAPDTDADNTPTTAAEAGAAAADPNDLDW